MEINIYVVAGIVAFLFGSGLAFFVGYNSWHNPSRRSFALVTQLAALWCLFPLAGSFNRGGEANLLLVRLVYIPGVLTPPFILQFIFDVTEDRRLRLKKWVLMPAYFVSICFIFFVFHPQFIVGVKRYPPLFAFVPGRIFHIFVAQYILICFTSFFLLIQNLLRVEPRNRTKLQYVALALTIAIFTPLFHWSGSYFKWEPFPHDIFFITYSSIIAYAIVRHQLLNIHVAIRRSLVYSILVTLLTAGYFGLIYGIERVFQTTFGYRSIWVSIAAFAVMALLFQPLKIGIQRLVDWVIFRAPHEELVKRMERLEEQALQAERFKAVSTMAAGMAHEIKSPLTALKTFGEFLPERGQDPKFLEKLHEVLTSETQRIQGIVQDLLNFAKPRLPQLRPIEVEPLIESTLHLLEGELLKRTINWKVECQHNGAALQADPDQLRQVLINLIQNAADAMSKGGTLTIATRDKNGHIEIIISDTGEGIPKKLLPKIFDPFVTTKEKGNGLGLAMVYSIIQAHRGSIHVESRKGHGTIFTVRLPR